MRFPGLDGWGYLGDYMGWVADAVSDVLIAVLLALAAD